MHLIATRDDLGTFAHVHPQPTGRPGQLAVDDHLPDRRPLHHQHRVPPAGPDGRHARSGRSITVAGAAPGPVTLAEGPRSRVVDGVRVELRRRRARRADAATCTSPSPTPPPAGRSTTCSPTSPPPATSWSCAPTGRRSPTSTPRSTDAAADPVFALPGQTFGPELDVHAEFPTPGTYRLWAQFRLGRRRRHHRPVHRRRQLHFSAVHPSHAGRGARRDLRPLPPPRDGDTSHDHDH